MGTLNSWDVVDALNNATPPDGWPENTMNYSDVNNTGRAVQGTVKRFFADINGSLDAAGVADAYTLSLNESGYSAYFDGMMFSCTIPATNTTTTPTIDVNGIGAATITDRNGNAIGVGELMAGGVYDFRHDGTNLRVIGGQGVAGATNEFQYNMGGAQAGSPGLTYNSGTDEATAVNPFNITNDLVFAEQADHTSTPTTGFGYLWVRASDNALIYTNELGNDTVLGTASGASPGGNDTEIQYNNSNAFAGDPALTWDNTNERITFPGFVYTSDDMVWAFGNRIASTAEGLPMGKLCTTGGGDFPAYEFWLGWGLDSDALVSRTSDGQAQIGFGAPIDDGFIVLRTAPDGTTQGTAPDWDGSQGVELRLDSGGPAVTARVANTVIWSASSARVSMPLGFSTGQVQVGENSGVGNIVHYADTYTRTTGTKNLDTGASKYFYNDLDFNAAVDITFAFTGTAIGVERFESFYVELNNGQICNSITWPGTVVWATGSEPVWTAGRDIVRFTHIGGQDYIGEEVALNT